MERATLASGRYLAHEAARLAGVDGDRIGQWARWGHIRASVSSADPHVYSFEDVAEALAVHLLLEAGFTLPLVRRAVERLGGAAGWPLSTGALHVVDHRLAVERGPVLEDVFTDQGVLPLNGRLGAVDLLRRGGWPAHVLGDLRHIAVDPGRLSGRPHLRGTRIPVEDVVAGPDVMRELDLTHEQVTDAVRWWQEAGRR